MFAYIIRRVFSGIIMLLLVSLVTFILFFASPVNPARLSCGKICSPALIEQNSKALGYDKPMIVQWGQFVKGIVAGREFPEDASLRKSAPETIATCPAPCLGYSPLNAETVSSELGPRIPVSASLALAAFVLWMVFGISFGIIAALRRGKFLDKLLVSAALVAYAFPTFFIGLFIYQFIALKWGLFPVPVYTPLTQDPLLWLQGLVLPAITLALVYLAGYVRLTRAFMLESMGEDYLRTAKAKGLAPRKILFKHTLRAALTPIVTQAGLDLGLLLGGAIITEQVFNYPGVGKLAVQAATTYDLPTNVGIVILIASFVVVANIIVDVLYGLIDPRVTLA
ncbi:ABC transporter permease [Leekyejoonella antrihumi]|uniref:ABC transporter permease n=1 Tax=Leekyejoonella antrihumi TaxID=1660198 RepID=A0A563DY23_9MICO|nr:ABC transporter permease [Leekyejoonella antrihumi]TWP34871.1 ABC transporter permease [Leekyejoonella antrihumi]